MLGTTADQLARTAAVILAHATTADSHAALCSVRTAHDGRWSHAEVHPRDLAWIEQRGRTA
jgi:homoserine acetyltransferase